MITITSLSNAYIIVSNLNLKPNETGVLDENDLVLSELKSINNLCIRNLIAMSSEDSTKVQNKIESFDSHGGSWGSISGDIDNQSDLKSKFDNIELTKANQDALEILVQLVGTKADQDYVVSEINRIIGGAPAALDTLNEIATKLGQDENQISTLLTLVGNCVKFDSAQSLTTTQKNQVLSNIGAASVAQGAKADTALQSNNVAAVALTGSYTDLLNKPVLSTVATSGSYSDLSNKPTIPSAQVNSDWAAVSGIAQILNKPSFATVATSGNYSDLSNKPLLSTVATSGSYTDLSNKPTIPASQVNSDWLSVSGVSQILNKPTLSTVATSGSYTDLSNRPSLSTVATSGSYTDLINKPSNATTTVDGFMSSADKTKLDGLSSSGGGLTHFAESFSNTGTNATIPVIALGASAARTETNISVVLTPKGTGAFIVGPVPAGSVTTGNARAARAIDIQTNRTASSQVASGNNSIAIGQSNAASGDTAIALGVSNNCNSQYSMALGSSCTAGYGSISLGNTALSGIYSFAAGLGATANHGIAIGYNAKAQYGSDATLGSMGIGYNAASSGNSSIAIGNNSKDNGYTGSIALGPSAQISGHYGIAIGNSANSGDRGICLGQSSSTSGSYGMALGYSTTASGSNSTVVGYNATDKGFTSWVRSLGGITVKGDWQERLYMPYATTTSSATTSLTTTGASTTTTNAFSFSTNGVFVISGHIMAKSTSTTPTVSVWEVKAVVKTGATASTAEFVGTPTITNIAVDTDASTWTVSLMLNASKQLVPVVNGADTVTIRWGANLTIKELLT